MVPIVCGGDVNFFCAVARSDKETETQLPVRHTFLSETRSALENDPVDGDNAVAGSQAARAFTDGQQSAVPTPEQQFDHQVKRDSMEQTHAVARL